ncbi:hypothetical protein [Mycolicibacterium sp.]|uniref:hypothetical protein n=1 Tax=Mycolicibacterium sp. TaxID=2320850 RepID=UPI0037C7054E
MAPRTARPSPAELPLLEELERAAKLRHEINRLYLALLRRAFTAGTRPSIIARYAHISPQAANSMRVRLDETPLDHDAAATVDEALQRTNISAARPAPAARTPPKKSTRAAKPRTTGH